MPNFIEGLLLILMIFGFCVGTAIIIKIGLMWLEQKKSEPAPVESAEPKIYLVKQTAASPKPKPKKRRSPKVAFEGLILKPENVIIAERENQLSTNESQRKVRF